jgi:hypothetical protein
MTMQITIGLTVNSKTICAAVPPAHLAQVGTSLAQRRDLHQNWQKKQFLMIK